jgi:outer membrane lipoprotein SlyB
MRRLNQKSVETIVAWVVLLSCALPVTVLLPRPVRADALPPSVVACAAEHDSRKRLACYDREVARFTPVRPAAVPSAAVPSAAGPPAAGPPAAAVAAAAAVGAGESKVTSGAQGASGTQGAAEPHHIAARIVSIEGYADEIVVHLDNGQIWQQVQATDADPNLHRGDAVTIDRSLGSYWLSGRSGTALKVKRRQ